MELLYIVVFSLIGGIFSLIGGFVLLKRDDLTEKFSIHLLSFAAGTLLGVVFLDLLPEAYEALESTDELFMWSLIGFVIFFIIEGLFFRLHHHGEHHHGSKTPLMLLVGDSLHNFLDGIAIAATFFISIPLGIITTLSTAAHEIPQEIGDFAVMLRAGWIKKNIFIANISSALMTTVGAILTFLFRESIMPFIGILLAITSGMFIYIAASDIIPEIYRTRERDNLSHILLLFIAGILVMKILVGILE
ncbi:MAG: hypothetical protein A3A04_02500 [Candidatus Harrisonbacteria bacterium RIFCSPLOWO2_01_FULL_40_28]|uniref:ZIP zinc transporter n=2 Tax=Candidatus Harrisoniibacteriota TaxID=1817905 RepID=A0A1G1ZX06_9BACT|nr:MAG: hypothetical protein A3A04_02500 [Candidatus Harrisonbacteria bacterium RIFCSPLOWO2_01_FULL_40_28]OGY68726.1 MAG: hypothetical protein A2586_00885 [Candidatus Harrisonbacteria bacterium RIFOXYD1_FULL_40_9]